MWIKMPKSQPLSRSAPSAWSISTPCPLQSNNNHRLSFFGILIERKKKNANHLKANGRFIVNVRYRGLRHKPYRGQRVPQCIYIYLYTSTTCIIYTHRIVEAKRVVLLGSVDSWHRTKWHCMLRSAQAKFSRVLLKLGYFESSVCVKKSYCSLVIRIDEQQRQKVVGKTNI